MKRIGRHFAAVFSIAALVSLLALAGIATAGEVHIPAGLIGEAGSGDGQLALAEHSGVAVDTATGNIYASDTGNHRVEEFEPDGTFLRTFSPAGDPGFAPTYIAVDNAAGSSDGDVYVADSSTGSVFKFEPDGTQVTAWAAGSAKLTFTELKGIALGPDGDLFVLSEAKTLRRYDEEGTLVGAPFPVTFTGLSQVDRTGSIGLAVDPEGDLYVPGPGREAGEGFSIYKLSATGEETAKPFGKATTGLATDPVSGDLYALYAQDGVGGYGVERLGSQCGTGCTPVELFAQTEFSDAQGIAVGPAGIVYVADAGVSRIRVYEVEEVEPPTVTIDPPTQVTATSAHVSGHIDPDAPAGDPPTYAVNWEFRCREVGNTEGALVNCGGVGGELPADSSEHLVEGTVTGLSPGTEYEVGLFARNAGGSVESRVHLTTSAAAPTVGGTFVTGVTTTEAILQAEQLNPHGAVTTYFFEYLPQAAFEAGGFAEARASATGSLPVGTKGEEVSARISGLTAGTPYAYRLVASNSVGPVEGPPAYFTTQILSLLPGGGCPNEVFRTFAGASLPDCRAYEQASPVDKGGQNVEGFPDLMAASADESGSEPAVAFYSQAGSGIPAAGGARQEYSPLLSSRVDGSWSTQRLLPPEQLGEHSVFLGASPNLRYALVTAGSETEVSLLLIDNATEEVVPLAHAQSGKLGAFADDAVGDDGSWVLFESQVRLPTRVLGPDGKDNLYYWNAATGEVSLVGVAPNAPGAKEKAFSGGSFGAAYEWLSGNTVNGGAMAGQYVEAIHAATSDGDQIYFTAAGTGQLYLRRGLGTAGPVTVKVSAPAAGAPAEAERPAALQEATPDGSRAFFLSSQKLTANATTGSSEEGDDLYRWDAASESLVDIAPDPEPGDVNGAEVQGLLGASSEGSSGYFVAKGHLAPGGTTGKDNIYRFEEEAGGFHLIFVADLNEGSDSSNWTPTNYGERVAGEGYEGKTSRVTPDGQELVFSSSEPITGYDSHSSACGEEGCGEIFMYRAGAERTICLSCDPTGSRAAGAAELTAAYLNAHLNPGVGPAPLLTRNVSADGSRVFFETPDSLVAADTNGAPACTYLIDRAALPLDRPRCMDVYEWEAPGASGGSCTTAEVNGGCLYLLSTGQSDEPSYFVDASADGADVYIATTSKLVPVDRDELYDVYDVRTDGGLASQQVLPAVPCAQESCRGRAEVAPAVSTPGSSSFQGPGNSKAEQCRKGFVRRRGKCVKRPEQHQRAKHRKKKHQRARHRTKKHHAPHPSRGGH